jgi:exodeoxyribonuclease VII large subunit
MNESLINNYREKIIVLSPTAILRRGYSICFKMPEKKIVKKINQVKEKNILNIMVSDGIITANVTQKEEYK